jgi:uncharacterized protein
MEIAITGGTGFIGSRLSMHLISKGHRITAFGSRKSQKEALHPDLRYVSADTTLPGPWQDEIGKSEVVVNLAGKSIFGYWTEKYKQAMYDSRILTTRNVVAALPKRDGPLLISASALGYYGDRGDDPLTESEPAGDDFLSRLSKDWEAEAFKARSEGARVVVARFGIVLGPKGGAMPVMALPFRFFLGGAIGDGRQWFSWIHIYDLMAALEFVMENPEITGAVNFGSPGPVRNRQLARLLGGVLRRPSFFRTPAFMIRLFLGEFGQSLLNSQRIVPENLVRAGFQFKYPEFENAVRNILRR